MSFPISKNSFTQHNQKTEPPVDTGLIRCVCPSTEDDGFTIQCERCLVWQHAFCVHITHANIPDHYLCDQCLKRKRPKLSKRITISKKKFRKLDAAEETLPKDAKKKRPVKSRIISRYVNPLFREARERWSSNNRWKQHFHDESSNHGPLLCDHGPFVTMDTTTLFTKGVLMDTPVSNQGLFAARPIPALRYLMEVTGDILLKSEFKFDPINDFVILGTPLSHIMFYPTLDLCIDTRQFGNKARYIRRSCHPNAELRNVVLPQAREDKTIHLGLFARHAIEKGQEVTISWNWQRGHISWKESMNWHHQHKQKHGEDVDGHQVIDEEEERRRKSTIKNMLDRFEKEFGVCACLNKRRCLIEHLRRQCAPLKEKPIMKFPSVSIISNKGGRRKSSVILLKPKPSLPHPVRVEEKDTKPIIQPVFINKTISKDTSDDELLDVEGDIDIGDDLPAPSDNAPPLLDDNSSDEENADLSSLSSLSSLSVFEDSTNDNSDEDENRAKSRKKKSSNRHHHHHHHHHNSSKRNAASSSSTAIALPTKAAETSTPIEKSFAPLPRKKLWMRDYLNKHNNSDLITKPTAIAITDSQNETSDTLVKSDQMNSSIKSENVAKVESKENTISIQPIEEISTIAEETMCTEKINEPPVDIINAEQDTKLEKVVADITFDTDAAKFEAQHPILQPEAQQNIEIKQIEKVKEKKEEEEEEEEEEEINVMQDTDTIMADIETVDVTNVEETNVEGTNVEGTNVEGTNIEETNVFDMDDGELSDASTILLDDDELEQVYKRDSPTSASDINANTNETATFSLQKYVDLPLKDETIPNNNNTTVNPKSDLNLDSTEKSVIVPSDDLT